MDIGTIFVVVVFSTLLAYIGWASTKRLLDYFFPDNLLRLTTIKADGTKSVEVFDLDKLSAEQIDQLRARLTKTVKTAKNKGANNE